MNNAVNISFLQNSPLGIKQTYSWEFSISQSTSEIPILIWWEASSFISFSTHYTFKFYGWDEFSVYISEMRNGYYYSRHIVDCYTHSGLLYSS